MRLKPPYLMAPDNPSGSQADGLPPPGAPPGSVPPSASTATSDAPPPASTATSDAPPPASTSTSDKPPLSTKPGESTTITWPENWRDAMSGGDPVLKAILERHNDPVSVGKKITEQEKLISSGKLRFELKPDSTPEEVAKYRRDNNIPETVDKYEVKLPEGMVLGDHDKPYLQAFLEEAHKGNLDQRAVSIAAGAYLKMRDAETAKIKTNAVTQKAATSELLKGELGGSYEHAIAALDHLLTDGVDPEVSGLIKNSILGDGETVFLNHSGVARFLLSIATRLYPHGTMVPNGNAAALATIEGRIAELEGIRSKNIHAYTQKMRVEYRELIDKRDAMSPKAPAK